MMLDYRDHSPDATADLEGQAFSAIDIRRARLGTKVKLADNIKGEVVLDISEDGAELDSAKMAYKLPNKMSMFSEKPRFLFLRRNDEFTLMIFKSEALQTLTVESVKILR